MKASQPQEGKARRIDSICRENHTDSLPLNPQDSKAFSKPNPHREIGYLTADEVAEMERQESEEAWRELLDYFKRSQETSKLFAIFYYGSLGVFFTMNLLREGGVL